MLTIGILVALVLLVLGVPIFACFLLLLGFGAMDSTRAFAFEFGGGIQSMFALGTGPIHAPILSTIPLFILTGFLMAESKTADRVVRLAQAAFGWLPGGLAVCTIFTCAVFTTFTGASGVTIVALGGLLMPSLLKQKYPERFSLGLLAGTGSVGLLFPPAVPLFVYGTIYGLAAQSMAATQAGELKLVDFSTDRFALAGIVPGLVLIGMLSIYVVVVAIKNKVPRQKFDLGELGRAFIAAFLEIIIPGLVIGGLLMGLLLPQLASMCVLYVLIIETLVYRDLKLSSFWKVIGAAMALAGAIFAIILCAQAFTNLLVTARVPQEIVKFISAHFEAKWSFLLALNVMLLIVGMVMDIFSAIVVVVPLIAPAAIKMGIDPFHLGVIFLLNLEVGYLHPPVGLNLFITSFTFKKPILEVTIAALPYLLLMIIALGVITYVPSLTVVPPAERRGRVAEMQRQVHNAVQELSAVQEVALPDGKTMKLAECDKMSDASQKEECKNLFLDVTDCRKTAAGKADSECEKKAIADYLQTVKEAADVEDWDTEDKPDAGAGDEKDEEKDEEEAAPDAAPM
ncbi:MAG TPA: TRAP transporter large permease [Kofleriaceae bacterium]